ncbi:Bacteroides conjugative transposon TraN protein [Chitinophaga costaii]|uniref:Bacteroides conjugative transposon TraN protein n=1 Tax=Chitinophaga costaii TaxID=1335309 RepID=A0A1C4EWD0_9BACT|nr:DUF4138 domain-containing protein [Chitinophaga costaii]PUZ21600.1 DUF4138 domain-containing protein [Chitinophaga costaii]SCC47910.1 Bacteroides conjugative transposon TraN protein [Chitinophaga costaii]
MKYLLVLIVLISYKVAALAQCFGPLPPFYDGSYHLPITYQKTTVLVFGSRILLPDIGSQEVLVEPLEGVGNILKVKAARPDFASTNMHVFTADGKIYSFIVEYEKTPVHFDFHFTDGTVGSDSLLFDNALKQSVLLDSTLKRLHGQRGFLHGPRAQSGGVGLHLTGIYYDHDVVFVRVQLRNRSFVPYPIDFTRCSIASRRRLRQKAFQETVLTPVAIFNPLGDVAAHSSNILVFAFDRFTLSHDQQFTLHVFEKGNRHLKIAVGGRRFGRTRLL